MYKQIVSCVVGLSTLVAVSLVNAATVSLTPSPQTVSVGDTFTLTVAGTDFTDGLFGGGVSLTWDSNILQLGAGNTPAELAATLANIETETLAAGFDDTSFNVGNFVNPGAADITFVDDFGDFVAGPSITFFTLDFTALQVTTSPTTVGVALGSFGAFGDPFFDEYTIDNFNGAQVSVNPRVPVPAAVWLFGSGLIGLIGVARRPTKTAITA